MKRNGLFTQRNSDPSKSVLLFAQQGVNIDQGTCGTSESEAVHENHTSTTFPSPY